MIRINSLLVPIINLESALYAQLQCNAYLTLFLASCLDLKSTGTLYVSYFWSNQCPKCLIGASAVLTSTHNICLGKKKSEKISQFSYSNCLKNRSIFHWRVNLMRNIWCTRTSGPAGDLLEQIKVGLCCFGSLRFSPCVHRSN